MITCSDMKNCLPRQADIERLYGVNIFVITSCNTFLFYYPPQNISLALPANDPNIDNFTCLML